MKILSNKQYSIIVAVHSAMHRLIAKQEHLIKEQQALIEKQRKQINALQDKLSVNGGFTTSHAGVNVDFPNTNERSKTTQENNTDIFSKF